jgi:polysaccharide biosynthesis protein PslH
MKVLVVTPQLDFPARSGFSMRVYQLVRQLAARHDVTLLTYVRPFERDGLAALGEELAVVRVKGRHIAPDRSKRAAQLRSIFSSEPFSCRSIYSEEMQATITELCSSEAFDLIQLESSPLCAFAFPPDIRLVLDEHNIESELLRRMCEGERSVARRLFSRLQARRHQRFERRCWRRVDGCLVTSAREEPIVRAAAPGTATAVVPNGVDLNFFAPSDVPPQPRTVVFNGVFDYRPNLDAAHWLVEEVWPAVVGRFPDASLMLVGRTCEADVSRLRGTGVEVVGQVPDVRPYLQRAAVVAVPVRIGGGTRLKVVEGLAMAKPMVSTSLGCEGLAVRDGEHLLIGDNPGSFALRILALFEDPALGNALGQAGHMLTERKYSWELAGEQVEALYRRVAHEAAAYVTD